MLNFTCTRDEFLKGIQAVNRVVASRGPLPILSNVLLSAAGDKLQITATDLEVGIEAKVSAQIESPGSVTLAARQLSEIINKLPNSEIAIKLGDDGARATVQCQRSRFVLPVLPAEEFPKLPTANLETAPVSLLASQLLKGIRQTSFAAAKDDKSVISGIYLHLFDGQLEIVATDGYRLAWSRWAMDTVGELKAIVPAKAMGELARLLPASGQEPVRVGLTSNTVGFLFEEKYLTSRLIDGQFPQYGQIVPKNFTNQVLVDRGSLLAAVERVSIMASEREAKVLKMRVYKDEIQLSANAADLGESDEQLPAEYQGEAMQISFNANYLADALKVLDGETVQIQLNGPLAPALLSAVDDPHYSYLLMPIRS